MVQSSTMKHIHSRVNASKSVFPPQKWMQQHENMPMGINWFLMVHLVFAPHIFFYLLPWALMNTGKRFHWPFSYFLHLQETKQHMQAIILRFSMSFSTRANHIFPMAEPHSCCNHRHWHQRVGGPSRCLANYLAAALSVSSSTMLDQSSQEIDLREGLWFLEAACTPKGTWVGSEVSEIQLNSPVFVIYLCRVRLLETIDYPATMNMLNTEQNKVLLVAQHSPTASCAYITYIDYLVNTWMPKPLWQSWSHKGHIITSTILKIPIEGVLPTTNHLEAFNGLLKNKYIPWWQRSGSHLHFNFLIHILITKILPDIFASCLSHQNYLHWVAKRFTDHTGGVNLIEIKKFGGSNTVKWQVVCWWEPDKQWDADSSLLLKHGHLHSVCQTVSDCQYKATCFSAQKNPQAHQGFNMNWFCIVQAMVAAHA